MLLILFIPTTHAVAVYQLDQSIAELNGYTLREVFENRNISMPSLIGKEAIEPNVFRLYNGNGVTIDYNLKNGDFIFNGMATGSITTNFSSNLPLGIYTITSYTSAPGHESFRILGSLSGGRENRPTVGETTITDGITIIKAIDFWIYTGYVMDNMILKVQIEKGSVSTPYQVPTGGPYNDIDVGQFNLTSQQIENYFNLYLEAVRFEQENIEASQDPGGYQNIFKSIINGVKGLITEMGYVWQFLNAPILTSDMQDYSFSIDWSWDLIGVVRQIINSLAILILQTNFIFINVLLSFTGIPIQVSILTLLFSNFVFVILGWIIVKSFII